MGFHWVVAPRKASTVWAQAGIYSGLGFVLFGGIAGGYLKKNYAAMAQYTARESA